MSDKKAVLLLEDGTLFEGCAVGQEGKVFGRAAFNTSAVGYQEALTNPANSGLLLVQTFPLIGNYGINSYGNESAKAWVNGYIMREICDQPSNYLCTGTLEDFMKEKGVVGICGIDTRHLTRHLRENGEMKGVICSEADLDKDALMKELAEWKPETAICTAGSTENKCASCKEKAAYKLLVLDMGVTNSFCQALINRGAELILRPATISPEEVKALAVDGIVLSDGAGAPAENPEVVANIRELAALGLPIFAVALGHQMLALSQGMTVSSMKYGHRGANQPVYRAENGRTYITTQNHVWVVDTESVDSAVASVSYYNANDKSVEGLSYRNIPAVSVQFLPDSKPGSQSTSYLFDEFFAMLKGKVNTDAAE